MIRFIDSYRDRFSVEFICEILNKERAGGFLTSRGCRDAKTGHASAGQVKDRELVAQVKKIQAANYEVYGVRKMWRALARAGIKIGREQTWRLMGLAGVKGKGKGRVPVTTRKARREDTRPDLVLP